VSSCPSCPELVRGAFRRVPTNAVATTFARHEPKRRGGEVHLNPRSCTYKYQGAVGCCPDGMAQHLSRGLPSTCGIETTSSCCTSPGYKGSYLSHGLRHLSYVCNFFFLVASTLGSLLLLFGV
jgi:hypothetical protein